MTQNISNPQSATCLAIAQRKPVHFFLWILALCLAAGPVRAAVTFTVSPNVVSNAYNGLVTLQINGLTNGVTNVVVQKFLDVNLNSNIDSGDLLVQQFRLTVGQLNVFTNGSTPITVTNFMPGDTSPVTDQMTIPLNFQNGDFAQTLVGHYLYKISSQTNSFTNLFIVTNSFFPCVVTGAVENAESTNNVTNALVLLCLNQSGPVVVQAGTVANNGTYSLRAPPGNYVVAAAKSNFVDDISQSGLALVAQTTTNGTISLTPATTNVTGRVFDSANSNGLGGVSGTMISTNSDYLSFYFTDTNGNFYAPVTSNFWKAPLNAFAVAFQGCLTPQSNQWLNVSNNTVKLANSLPPENAIFYGVVSNGSAAPMPGVYVYAYDNAGHQSIGMTDSRGKYVVGVAAETNTNVWNLSVLWPNNPGLTSSSYVFGPGFLQTNMQPGQAVQQSFSFLTAPYSISGTVKDYNGNPIVGVQVFATNGLYAAANALTASDGSYTNFVAPGMTWTVGIDSNSLVNANASYTNVPAIQTVTISDSDVTGINFIVQVCGEIDILTTNLPDAILGEPYDTEIQAQGCQSISTWSTANGITLTSIHDSTNAFYPAGTPIYSETKRIGFLESSFSFGVNSSGNGYFINCSGSPPTPDNGGGGDDFANLSATVELTGPIDSPSNITVLFPNAANGRQLWTAEPTTQNGSNYSTTLTAGEYTNNPIAVANSVNFNAGSELTLPSGTSSNRLGTIVGGFHSQTTPGISSIAAMSTAFTNQDNSTVWIQWGTNISEYIISAYGPQPATNLPPGLSLFPDGSYTAAIMGTPTSIGTNGGTFNFSVMAEDTSSNVTVQPLSIFVFPATTFTGPSSAQAGMVQSSNTFQMQLNGLTNEFNYTVLMSTNLASTNWVPIFTANNPTNNSLIVPDTTATNAARFYRLQISQ